MTVQNESSTDELKPIKLSLCGSLRKDLHWKCLILTLLIYGCLVAISWCRLATANSSSRAGRYNYETSTFDNGSPCNDGFIYIPVAFVIMLYLVYLVECWHCHTRIELQYKVDIHTVYERVQRMKSAIPVIWWKAVCYHYVRRTRQVTRYRNGDAFTTTQVYYERVNSHTAGSAFDFTACGYKDVSRVLAGLEDFPATKIKFSKGFSFANLESECDFEDQRANFFQQNESRDDYMEAREGMDLLNVNFKEYMVSFADPDNLPWYVSHVIFWIASFFLMSWPLRVIVEYKTAYVHFHVHKLFGTSYLDPSNTAGQMVRVNTMGSSDIEMNILNNNTMVPSYSEALLMDPAIPSDRNDCMRRTNSRIFSRSQTYGSLGHSLSSGYINGFFGDNNANAIIRSRSGMESMITIQRGMTSSSIQNSLPDVQHEVSSNSDVRKKKKRRSLLSLRDTVFSPNVRLATTPESPGAYNISLNFQNNSATIQSRVPNSNSTSRPTHNANLAQPESSSISSDAINNPVQRRVYNSLGSIPSTDHATTSSNSSTSEQIRAEPPSYDDALWMRRPTSVHNGVNNPPPNVNDSRADSTENETLTIVNDRRRNYRTVEIIETSL